VVGREREMRVLIDNVNQNFIEKGHCEPKIKRKNMHLIFDYINMDL